MDSISIAVLGIAQSTGELVNSSKALSAHVEDLVAAIRTRELLLIQAARQYPHLPAAAIIAACSISDAVEPADD